MDKRYFSFLVLGLRACDLCGAEYGWAVRVRRVVVFVFGLQFLDGMYVQYQVRQVKPGTRRVRTVTCGGLPC